MSQNSQLDLVAFNIYNILSFLNFHQKMSQNQIQEIQQVSSVSSSSSSNHPAHVHNNLSKSVHFHPHFSSSGIRKIEEFVEIHKLSLEHFWRSDKFYFGYQDIKQMCQNVGLRLEDDDELDIKQELFHTNLVISIQDFKNYIKTWKHYSDAKTKQFLQKKTDILNDSIFREKENIVQKKPKRPLSSITYNRNKPLANYENKSIQYLKLQKAKAKQQQNKLTQAINKAKNQEQYQVLIKMGEANDLNREMESLYTYRAYKNAQGNLRVKVFNLDRFQKQINLQQFQREFNSIKKKYNQSKNLNIWQMLATCATKKTSNFDTRELSSLSKKNVKTVDRQRKKKKLVEILSETINLTNIFKQQLRILKSQGIYKRAQ